MTCPRHPERFAFRGLARLMGGENFFKTQGPEFRKTVSGNGAGKPTVIPDPTNGPLPLTHFRPPPLAEWIPRSQG